MIKKFLFFITICGLFLNVAAQKYYWVGGSGNWSDTSHWSTSSGGGTFYSTIPGPADTVCFDALSFTADNQIVSVNSTIYCAGMDWSGIGFNVEFSSSVVDTLFLSGDLTLSDKLTFNQRGAICVEGTGVRHLNTINKILRCDVVLSADSMVLNAPLHIPFNYLKHLDGSFNANDYLVYCRHFNTDTTLQAPVSVNNPHWISDDTLIVSGSFAPGNAMTFDHHGVIIFQNTSVSLNYINSCGKLFDCDVIFSGSKTLLLLDTLRVSGLFDITGSGTFRTQSFPMFLGSFHSSTPLSKSILLDNSVITLSHGGTALNITDANLVLDADNAEFYFTSADTVHVATGIDSVFAFGDIHLSAFTVLQSSLQTSHLIVPAGAKLWMDDGIDVRFAQLTADGNCGHYIYISSWCAEKNLHGSAFDCSTAIPSFTSLGANVNVSFCKIMYNQASGATFTAVNSYMLDHVYGWAVSQPAVSDTYYWINGSGNWNDPAHWSTASNGTPGACIPSPGVHVVFDDHSFSNDAIVILDDNGWCSDMNWSLINQAVDFTGNGSVDVAGSLYLSDTLTISLVGGVTLTASSANEFVTANNALILAPFYFNSDHSYKLNDDLVVDDTVCLVKGILNLNSNELSCLKLDLSGDSTRTFDYSNTFVHINGSGLVWNAVGSNLSILNSASVTDIAYIGNMPVLLNPAGFSFDTLLIKSPGTKIFGHDSIALLKLFMGVTLEIEPSKTLYLDSLVVNSSCERPVTLSSFFNDAGHAFIRKSGVYDSLLVSGIIIQNVVADTADGKFYQASQSAGIGETSGWNFTLSSLPQTYYWTGDSSQSWHDAGNWHVLSGLGCIPGPADTVVFDSTYFKNTASDSVVISRNAYCRMMDWRDFADRELFLKLDADLSTYDDVSLYKNLHVQYSANFSSSDDAPPALLVHSDSMTLFDPACLQYDINTCFKGWSLSDSIVLTDTLLTDSTASLSFLSGSFFSMGNDIQTGLINTSSDSLKSVSIKGSSIVVKYSADFQQPDILSLNADSSYILMPGNYSFSSHFSGGNQRFFDVEFIPLSSDSANVFYRTDVFGADTFRIFKTYPGMRMFFEANKNVTIDSAFIAHGTCDDLVYLNSSINHVQALLTYLGVDSLIQTSCTHVGNMNAVHGAVSVFSFDDGSNINWIFDPTPAAVASFSLNGPACFGDSVEFLNNSASYAGTRDSLTFFWDFGVDSSSVSTDSVPSYYFENDYSYIVSLTATYVNGCSDTYVDTIVVYKPQISLNCSEYDTTICAGDQVTMMATSSNPSPQFFFYANGVPVMQSPDSTDYVTDSIALNEQIFAVVDYMGCLDTSSIFTFNVNPLPTIDLISSDIDATICLGDAVTLTTSGADQYMLYLNGVQYDNLDSTNLWDFNNIADADEFTVFGRNTTTGCEAFSSDTLTFSVLPLPVVALTSSEPDTTICDGDTVVIHASGAAQYIFYLNGTPLGPQSAVDSVVISTLSNNDIVSVEGISASGCRNFAAGNLEFNVEVKPLLSFISDDNDSRICAGEQITFQAGGATEYQFFIDGLSTGPLSTNNSLTSAFTNGQTVSVQGRLGNCYSFADSVFTIDVRPTITWTYSDSVICANEAINFEADGDSIYQYFIDGTPVTPLHHDSLYLASGLTNGQVIYVTGTNLACTPSPLSVVVHPVPLVPVSCSEPDTAICQGNNISFTATGSETYGFYINGSATGPYSTVNVFSSTSLNNGDTISVQAVSSDGCHSFSADTFIVEVAPNPVVSMSQTNADLTICAGDTVSFSASGASTYEFFVTGASQGAPSAVSTLTLSSLSNGNIVTVQGTTGYCTSTSSDVYLFTVNPIPNITFNPVSGTSVCTGDTIRLLAGGASSYQFFVDGLPWGLLSGNSLFACDTLSTGNVVSVEGTLVGCTGIAATTYTVTVNDYPVLSFINDIPSGSICYGDTVTFEGNGAQNYTFYLEGVPVSADTVFISSDLQNGQEVTLYGYNGVCGLWADTTMTVLVNYVDVALSSDMPSTALCAGSAVQFTASGADLYEFFVDGVSQGSPSATNVFSPAAINDGQVVSVIGTSNTSGCAQTAFNDIYVHIIDLAVITASPDDVFCEGDSVLLSSSVNENNHWFFEGTPVAAVTDSTIWAYEGGNYYSVVSAGSTGKVWSCGENSLGQFGDGTTFNNNDMQPSALTTHAVEVACGAEFTLVLNDDGTVKAWGRNEFGALGNGNYTDSNLPVSVGSLTGIQKIAAGNRFALALKNDGTLVSWGENTYGQLGYGNNSTSNFPFAVLNLDSIVDIAAGENHALALTQNGHVWAWGRNQAAQLGDSSQTNRNIPVLVKQLDDVVAIAAGANHSMALKSDGSLWVWGSNANGQLGTGSVISEWIPVKVNLYNGIVSFDGGSAHSLACDTMGILYAWGDNTFGQLGVASVSGSLFPVVSDISGGVVEVKAGKFSSYALRADSNLVSWGQNQAGQLGYSGAASVFTPLVIDQTFGIGSFDAGDRHLAVIPVYDQSCSASGITLTMDTVPAIDLVVNGLNLSTTTSGVSYQWYYNGSAIPGATGTSVTIAAIGTYYVVVTFANGCSGFSEEYQYGTGFDESGMAHMLLYPNPSDGEFTVMLSANAAAQSWRMINAVGQVVASQNVNGLQVFDVRGIQPAPGVYSIQVLCTDGAVISTKFTVTE